jgi:hypothetical protein
LGHDKESTTAAVARAAREKGSVEAAGGAAAAARSTGSGEANAAGEEEEEVTLKLTFYRNGFLLDGEEFIPADGHEHKGTVLFALEDTIGSHTSMCMFQTHASRVVLFLTTRPITHATKLQVWWN